MPLRIGVNTRRPDPSIDPAFAHRIEIHVMRSRSAVRHGDRSPPETTAFNVRDHFGMPPPTRKIIFFQNVNQGQFVQPRG